MAAGRLFLIASWLSEDTAVADVVPAAALARIRSLDAFVVENAKSARAFLAACDHPRPMREIEMHELSEHTPRERIADLLAPLLQGRDLGMLSEAGAPAVADPGAHLVAEAHARGIGIVPLVGPSSILLALMASGLEGQRFRFVGYLPAESSARRMALAELERRSLRDAETQVFIETPYRNDALLADLLGTCRPDTQLAVAVELTAPTESVRMQRIADWRDHAVKLGKHPAIFLLLAK